MNTKPYLTLADCSTHAEPHYLVVGMRNFNRFHIHQKLDLALVDGMLHDSQVDITIRPLMDKDCK